MTVAAGAAGRGGGGGVRGDGGAAVQHRQYAARARSLDQVQYSTVQYSTVQYSTTPSACSPCTQPGPGARLCTLLHSLLHFAAL